LTVRIGRRGWPGAAVSQGRLFPFYHDDTVNWQVVDEPVTGKAQIREMLAQFFAAFPDSSSRVENLIGDGEWAAWEWVGGGTFVRDPGAIKATGKPYELRGCGFFRIVGGNIQLQRGSWVRAPGSARSV